MDRDALVQFVKFGVAGGALTVLVSALYLAGVRYFNINPGLSLTIATIIATCIGYFTHSEYTFRGHGGRDRAGVRFIRFGATNTATYLLNLTFVLLLVNLAGLPEWVPVILFFLVTPAVSFLLNRRWVFS